VKKDAQIAKLLSENTELKADKLTLTQRVDSLEAKVLQLLEQLANSSPDKDSHNSHNPPSQDKFSYKAPIPIKRMI